MENLENEIWKNIPGYEETHQVSNFGRVKKKDNGILIKNRLNEKGYLIINLTLKSKSKTFKVHRLVALAFLPNPLNKNQVNHKDYNKNNNHLENLEWVSHRENSCHAVKKNEKSSSKYLGVCFRKNTNKWVSSIRYQKKSIHLGYFKTEEEAYEARKKFEQDNGISNKYI